MKIRILAFTLAALATFTVAPSANARGYHRGYHPGRGYGSGYGIHRYHEHRFWRGRQLFWEYVPGYGWTWVVITPAGLVPIDVDSE